MTANSSIEFSNDAALCRVAQRMCWWKSPDAALADPVRFAAQVMTYGTWDDVQITQQKLGRDLFRKVLTEAPPGVFDEASWAYWHHVFGLKPVPELPKRNLC